MDSNFINSYIKNKTEQAAKVAEIDAELNGGALVEVASILGKPLYMRVNHHDMYRAAAELKEMQQIVRDVTWPENE